MTKIFSNPFLGGLMWDWIDTEHYSVFNTGLIQVQARKLVYRDGYLVRYYGVNGHQITIGQTFIYLEDAKVFAIQHLHENILPALITILKGLEVK